MSTDALKDDILEQKEAIKNYLDCLFDKNPRKKVESAANIAEHSTARIPQWAKDGFSALNFRSAGLQLYVPVSFVRGIKNIGGCIDKLEGASEWIKGTITSKGDRITVIDTEKLVADEGKRTVGYQHPDSNSYVILLGDGTFGLVCDTVGQVKQVSVKDVHWRVNSSKHRWLAGMMQTEVAALIDARRLALAISMESTLV